MTQTTESPSVSVVIETANVFETMPDRTLADALRYTITALEAQRYPRERLEIIIVIEPRAEARDEKELREQYPRVTIVRTNISNYFAAKNRGAAVAHGDIVALLDGDCVPEEDWVERLVAALGPGVSAVAGRGRYPRPSLVERTFSVPAFGYVFETAGGEATGFNLHNAAFRREVLLSHPFDERLRRNGGCYLQFHQLRAEGLRVVYAPDAKTMHRFDPRPFSYVKKHFERGYDGLSVYRCDDRALLRGTRLYRRIGALALVPITARRILGDWMTLARNRRQIGISLLTLPYHAAVSVNTRVIELAGGLTAAVAPRFYPNAVAQES